MNADSQLEILALPPRLLLGFVDAQFERQFVAFYTNFYYRFTAENGALAWVSGLIQRYVYQRTLHGICPSLRQGARHCGEVGQGHQLGPVNPSQRLQSALWDFALLAGLLLMLIWALQRLLIQSRT